MATDTKSFLERLQSADQSVKRRWLMVSTIVATIIVVYIWLAYFNNLVVGFSSPAGAPAGGSAEGFTFWQAVRNGSAILYEGFMDKLKLLGSILSAPREYIVQPPH